MWLDLKEEIKIPQCVRERERANDFSHWLVFPELCYCWLFQFAKYECSQAALSNNNINPEGLLTLYSGNTSNFGTPYSPGAVGCACGALDTCATPDLTCNCDARGPLASDQGFITDSSVLPVVGFYRNIRSPSGRGRLSLTSVRCGPMWAYGWSPSAFESLISKNLNSIRPHPFQVVVNLTPTLWQLAALMRIFIKHYHL